MRCERFVCAGSVIESPRKATFFPVHGVAALTAKPIADTTAKTTSLFTFTPNLLDFERKCRRRDSNPYNRNPSADFKSATSDIPSHWPETVCSISQIGGIGGGCHTISGQEANQAFHPQRHGHIPHNLGRELGLERETVERDAR